MTKSNLKTIDPYTLMDTRAIPRMYITSQQYKANTVQCKNEPNQKNHEHSKRKQLNNLSKTKIKLQSRLDGHLDGAYLHCYNDRTSHVCNIMWNDIYRCLEEIDLINQEIKIIKWQYLTEDDVYIE